MRKLLLLFLFSVALVKVKSQNIIKVEQYKIIVDKTVSRAAGPCYKWSDPQSTAITPGGCISYFDQSSNSTKFICKVLDNDCSGCSTLNDFLATNFYKNGNLLPQFSRSYPIGTILPGTTKQISDTIYLYQSQFDITSIRSIFEYSQPILFTDWMSNPRPTNPCRILSDTTTLIPSGVLFDQVITKNSQSHQFYSTQDNSKYFTTTRIRIVLNTDPILTLPSHDTVRIVQTSPTNYTPVWKYSILGSGVWLPVPIAASGTRGDILQITGAALLGPDYINHLNETILIRAEGNGGSIPNSETASFVLRLSSPHIKSVDGENLNCYERNEGSMKIKFDRQLFSGERLNIFLMDTTNRLNYSTFNLDQLAEDSSYTWPNELRAGVYFISMVGKYAKGLPYNLTITEREDTVLSYKALNSINFEDSFNTKTVDSFDAFTDFEGYSLSTFTGSNKHFSYKKITQPEQIVASVTVDRNVTCKGTAAGAIRIWARGGYVFPDQKVYYKYSITNEDSTDNPIFVPFVNQGFFSYGWFATEPVSGLKAGKYLLRVRDSVDCYAKDSLGNEVTYPFEITEPEKGITVDELEIFPITSIDSANGYFKIKITGGSQYRTILDGNETTYDEAYVVELRDSATNTLLHDRTDYSDTTIENVYSMQSRRFDEGTYVLRVFDKSYNATDPYNAGCYLEMTFHFIKPDPLIVNISKNKSIDCYNDRNGGLLATVTGGIPNDTTRYAFRWFRLTGEGSTALPGTDTLIHVTDSVITGLAQGTYRVEVTDKYGTIAADTFFLQQPTQLSFADSVKAASCYSSFDGRMSVTVTGGTPYSDPLNAYRYEWSTGHLTRVVDSVAGGEYIVVVRDSAGCIAKHNVTVTSPVRVIANDSIVPVTCYNSNDGQIILNVTGGDVSQPYQYLWSNNATTATASGLAPGTYWYRVSDYKGCFDTDTLTLTRPDTILVDLGPDRKLCINQVIRLNATVKNSADPLTYSWQGPGGKYNSDGARANITGSGSFVVSVANTTGCVIKDTLNVINQADTINTDFVVSTQAYKNESVILVNLSKPYPPDSLLWIIPQQGNTVRMLNQTDRNCELVFGDTGRYELSMRVYYHNGCIDDTTKPINIIARDNFGNIGNQANAYLKVYAVIVPNPNAGTFDVQLTFSENTRARLRIINTLTNYTVDARDITITEAPGVHTEYYSLDSTVPSGIYALVIDAPKGSFVYKLVITR